MLARAALAELWTDAGLPPASLERVTLEGADPVLPSTFAVGAAAQASIAAATVAAGLIGKRRGLPAQDAAVDMRHAAVEFRSERLVRVDGASMPDPWDKIAGTYRCGDGAWVRLHTNFPHHRDGVLQLLGCAHERDAVSAALQGWTGQAVEDGLGRAGLVGSRMRSFAEWDRHPHRAALAEQSTVSIDKIGEAPPRAADRATRPLAGLRVLDLTRVIAGPICGRTLAAHGADVLSITGPHLPSTLVQDTGRGKLSAALDLRQEGDREQLRALARDADFFVQGYRPGGLAALGFAPHELAALRPGLIIVSLSAYGHLGPWSDRRGFDSLVQTATGFNQAEAAAAGQQEPKPLPAQVLDHASGYLLAFGALAALHRQMTEGGTWLVRVSLARTAAWLRDLGRIEGGLGTPDIDDAACRSFMEESASGFGRMSAVRHAGRLSETPPAWERPSVPLGTHAPIWPARNTT